MAAQTSRAVQRLAQAAGSALDRAGSRRHFLPGLAGLSAAQRRRTFEQQRVVRYPVSTIYEAVADVDGYAEFLRGAS
jgi:hypothetical protein